MDHRELITKINEGLPLFHDGRIDFTQAAIAPIINILAYHEGQILILRRSSHVKRHKGLWSHISSIIDRPLTGLEDFARSELKKVVGISGKVIKSLHIAEPYKLVDAQNEQRHWLIFPVLVELHKKPPLTLNWKNTDYAWIKPEQITEYPRPARIHLSVERALAAFRQSAG